MHRRKPSWCPVRAYGARAGARRERRSSSARGPESENLGDLELICASSAAWQGKVNAAGDCSQRSSELLDTSERLRRCTLWRSSARALRPDDRADGSASTPGRQALPTRQAGDVTRPAQPACATAGSRYVFQVPALSRRTAPALEIARRWVQSPANHARRSRSARCRLPQEEASRRSTDGEPSSTARGDRILAADRQASASQAESDAFG